MRRPFHLAETARRFRLQRLAMSIEQLTAKRPGSPISNATASARSGTHEALGNGKAIRSFYSDGSYLPHGHMQQHRLAYDCHRLGVAAGRRRPTCGSSSTVAPDRPTNRERPGFDVTLTLRAREFWKFSVLPTPKTSSTETGTSSYSKNLGLARRRYPGVGIQGLRRGTTLQ